MQRMCLLDERPILLRKAFEGNRVFDHSPLGPAVPNPLGVCYTELMFIHRISIEGCDDRGAWPWRRPQEAQARA